MCALIILVFIFVSVTVCFGNPTDDKITVNPTTAIKNVGEDLNVLCTVPNTNITDCLFDIGGITHKLMANGDKTYYGNGLETGECGATIKNISMAYHGGIICKVLVTGELSYRTAQMTLTVRKMPKDPVLTLEPPNGPYVEGSVIKATCDVNGGRPAPQVKISVKGDDSNNDQNIRPLKDDVSMTKTMMVSTEGDKLNISCAAHHDAWADKVRYTSKVISVHYKPRIHDDKGVIQKGDIIYTGLVIGENATVLVKVKSEPKPTQVRWAVGNTTIGRTDERIRTGEIDEENDIYLYTLTITNLTKADVLNTYSFEATNTIGSAAVDITLRSKKEIPSPGSMAPQSQAGGTTVGIIFAGVALVLIGGAVLFAKINKKCCFASKGPVRTGRLVVHE